MKPEILMAFKNLLVYGPLSGCLLWRDTGTDATNVPEVKGKVKKFCKWVRLCHKNYKAAEICWYLHTGVWPDCDVEFVGAELDLRWENLKSDSAQKAEVVRREVVSPNRQLLRDKERIERSRKAGGRKAGVTQRCDSDGWKAHISSGGKRVYLGTFKTYEEACRAVEAAEDKILAAAAPDLVSVVEERVHVSEAASGHVGVYQRKGREGWLARIEHNQQQIHLGQFDKLEDAIQARKDAEEAIKDGKAPERAVRRLASNNSSGRTGVVQVDGFWWRATYKGKYLGMFKTKAAACKARDAAERGA